MITVDGNYCANYAGPPEKSTIHNPITITCPSGTSGRVLKMLRQVSNDNFQFCEVKVFGKLYSISLFFIFVFFKYQTIEKHTEKII